MRTSEFIIILLLLSAIAIGGYFIWLNLPAEPLEYVPFVANITQDTAPEEILAEQFYNNMRFPSADISYSISDSCADYKKESVERAFSIISEKTIIRFFPSSTSPEIIVSCSDSPPEKEDSGHFIAGEGGPTEIINTSRFNVILSGKVALYREESCDEPKIAIHEILHVLGFNHSSDSNSIMYPITGCSQKIDSAILDEINSLYSISSFADLGIESVNATKKGSYLDFRAEVMNYGLKDSADSTLIVFSGDKKAGEFELGEIGIGMKKILTVENSRIARGSTQVSFLIESNETELFKQNNIAELNLAV